MKFLLIFLIALSAFGQSQNPNDTLKIGNKASGADKGLIFETNDGVSNKTLKVNPTSKALIWSGNDLQMGDGASANDKSLVLDPSSSTSIQWNGTDSILELLSTNTSIKSNGNVSIESQDIKIGEGSDADTVLEFDIGLGATNPKLKWDSAKGKFRQSIGGLDKDLGSGSGSGGGENFNNAFTADQNANAEDGTASWTASAGTFAVNTSDPLEGDQSFEWTPSAQNDTLDSAVLDVDKDIFLGRSCQANIEYIGGDENLTLQVIDADNDVLASQVLPSHSISGVESVFFLCPNSAGTANDKYLRLRLLNEGATASALIKFDKAYVGTLIGLTETTLPDIISAKVFCDPSSSSVLENDYNLISSIDNLSGGVCDITFSAGTFTETPYCWNNIVDPNGINSITSVIDTTSTTARLRCINTSGSSCSGTIGDHEIFCQKQGADAKQSVQVYKSIPKVSENVNEFSASIDDNGAILSESTEWINGNCSNPSTGVYECDISSLNLSNKLSCSVSPARTNFNVSASYDETNSSNTLIRYLVFQTIASSASNQKATLVCQKQGTDFKLPTVQPVIVGQVANSYAESASKNVRIESCGFNATGFIQSDSGLCESWVDSTTVLGTGNRTINFVSGIFSQTPDCFCTVDNSNSSDRECHVYSNINTSSVGVKVTSNSTDQNYEFNILCLGKR
jgi:hypothetical protein